MISHLSKKITGTLLACTCFSIAVFLATFYFGKNLMDRMQQAAMQSPKITIPKSPPTSDSVFYDGIGPSSNSNASSATRESMVAQRNFTIEVSSHNSQEEAQAAVIKLNEKGYKAFMTPKKSSVGKVKYHVRTGVFTTKESALKLSKSMTNSLGRRMRVGIL